MRLSLAIISALLFGSYVAATPTKLKRPREESESPKPRSRPAPVRGEASGSQSNSHLPSPPNMGGPSGDQGPPVLPPRDRHSASPLPQGPGSPPHNPGSPFHDPFAPFNPFFPFNPDFPTQDPPSPGPLHFGSVPNDVLRNHHDLHSRLPAEQPSRHRERIAIPGQDHHPVLVPSPVRPPTPFAQDHEVWHGSPVPDDRRGHDDSSNHGNSHAGGSRTFHAGSLNPHPGGSHSPRAGGSSNAGGPDYRALHYCVDCGIGPMNSESDYLRHLQSLAHSEKQFFCHCGLSYTRQDALERHQMDKH